MADNLGQALTKWSKKLEATIDDAASVRITNAAGAVGKKAALAEAARKLGPDRKMSGLAKAASGGPSKTALSAGYDRVNAHSIEINMRPVGLWSLANSGRKRSGLILPRVSSTSKIGPGFTVRASRGRGRKIGPQLVNPTAGRAVLTPDGYRAYSRYTPSKGARGGGLIRNAKKDIAVDVPRAAHKQFESEVARALRG